MAKSGQHGGNVRQKAQQYGSRTQDIIDFSANINPLGMPTKLKQAIVDQFETAHHYPDIDYVSLNQAIAVGIGCDEQYVLAGNGATELIYLWVKQLKPQRALVVEPSFAEYRRALAAEGCDIETFQLTYQQKFTLDHTLLDALHSELDAFILCTPNNPTGSRVPQHLLREILNHCLALNISVLLDESFIDFVGQEHSAILCLEQYPNLTVLQSLTKFYAIPGLRLGYVASSNPTLINAIHNQREPWSINAFAVIAGETVFECDDFKIQTRKWLQQESKFLFSKLQAFTELEVWPSEVNYLFFRCHKHKLDLQDALMQQGILIRSCSNYPGLSIHDYRVAIKSHADNLCLVQALSVILKAS